MIRRLLLVVPALLLIAIPVTAGRLGLDGYVKSFVAGFDRPDLGTGAATADFTWAANNRVRLNLTAPMADWLKVTCAYDLSLRVQDDQLFATDPTLAFSDLPVYRVDDPKELLWPDHPGSGDHFAVFQNIDRLLFSIARSSFDLAIGRQAIAWGSGRAVNPTDIFAPFVYTQIDTEDRVGVDAIRLRVPAGSLGEVDAGFVAGEDLKWKRSATFVRSKFSAAGTDVGLMLVGFREHLLAGFDVTRNAGGAGVWCEAAGVWEQSFGDGGSGVYDYVRLSVGSDYNFNVGAGVYTFVEYHFNGAGVTRENSYISNSRGNRAAYVDGSVYLWGKHYLVPGTSLLLSPLASLSAQTLINLTDGSLLVTPYFEYNVSENAYLSLGGFAAVGRAPANLGDGAPAMVRSEFGAYPHQFYAFLRYYF